MKKFLLLVLFSTLLLSNEEINLESDFLQSLDEVSEIATKTKLNIDDAPSFVTVLHSDKLQKLGIDTLYEALTQVPGVQFKREVDGVPIVIFRGVTQKGEVKLMVDGVTINNTYRGSIYYFLDFPIELIERIEVIRGAGSTLYGSGAISGVINVITKSTAGENLNEVFVTSGTYNTYKGGAIVTKNINDSKISLDTYYQKNDKEPDTVDSDTEDYSVGVHLTHDNFELIARIKGAERGNAYGVFDVPDKDENKYDNTNQIIYTQLSYQNSLNKQSDIKVTVGFNQYKQNIESKHLIFGDVIAKYKEDSYYAETNIESTMIANNDLALIGFRYELTHAKKSNWSWANPNPLLPSYAVNPASKRETSSIYINDKYILNSDIDISAGLRYDYYSDVGDAFSPTVGIVYRTTKNLRLKVLYTHAFRAPSWVEINSVKETKLKAETSNSFELGVAYKANSQNALHFNIYRTVLDDMITKDALTRKYIQNSYAKFTGGELEYNYSPLNQLEFDFLASYINAKDSKGKDIPDVANTLATASALYQFDSGLSTSSLLKYISSSKRSQSDIRDTMPSSLILDGTISYIFKDITASLTIKDIFDKGSYYALPPSTANNDFYDGGRSFLAKIAWEF